MIHPGYAKLAQIDVNSIQSINSSTTVAQCARERASGTMLNLQVNYVLTLVKFTLHRASGTLGIFATYSAKYR